MLAKLEQLEQLEQLGKLLAKLLRLSPFRGATQLLVLQGTPLCNLNCSYCYLPNRDDSRRMSMETVEAAMNWIVQNGLTRRELTVVWHAGEPMVLPPTWYFEAMARIATACPPEIQLSHAFQTNGVLVNDTWCDFFRTQKVSVGVSLDGPAVIHDAHRRTRNDRGSFAATLRGFRRLEAAGLNPHVIAVVSQQTLRYPDAFIDFFTDLAPVSLGLNFEETEGVNTRSSLDGAQHQAIEKFLCRLVDRSFETETLHLREVDQILSQLRAPVQIGSFRHQENDPFRIVTVDVEGGIHTFSPELAGVACPGFDGRPLGNVHNDSLEKIIAAPTFLRLRSEIDQGVDACREECKYFPICGGGGPSNKLAERQRFDVSETTHCRIARKLLGEIVLKRIEQDLSSDAAVLLG